MSLSAARTQMCVPADSLGLIDHSAQSCSWMVLYWQTAARCERPGHMRWPNMRRSCPRADDRVSRGTGAALCQVLSSSQRGSLSPASFAAWRSARATSASA